MRIPAGASIGDDVKPQLTNRERRVLSTVLLRGLLDGASEAKLIIDQSGIILLTNQRALDLFGYAPAELDGQIVERLMPARFRLQHIGFRLGFTDQLGMRMPRPLIAQRKDGSEVTVRIGLRAFQHGLQNLVSVAIWDVASSQGS